MEGISLVQVANKVMGITVRQDQWFDTYAAFPSYVRAMKTKD